MPNNTTRRMTVETFIWMSEDEFVPIHEIEGQLDPNDYNHVRGSIEMTIDGKMFLERDNWDDMDWFWPSLVDAITTVATEKQACARFPSQDTQIEMTLKDGHVFLVIDRGELFERRAQFPAPLFVPRMLQEARQFFEFLRRALPFKRANWEIDLKSVDEAEQTWRELL